MGELYTPGKKKTYQTAGRFKEAISVLHKKSFISNFLSYILENKTNHKKFPLVS